MMHSETNTVQIVAVWVGLMVLAGSVPVGLQAQSSLLSDPALAFERIDSRAGLSHNTVNAILQDREGYLWIGTSDGLNRYDGYTFVVYRHDPLDTTSLSHNRVRALFEDHDGTLWVATEVGLDQFDPSTEQFIRHDPWPGYKKPGIWGMGEGAAGTLWIGDVETVDHYDARREKLTSYAFDGTPRSLSLDANGVLWVSVRTAQHADTVALYRYDADREAFARVEVPSLQGIEVYVHAGYSGTLWVGTSDQVGVFDRATRRFFPIIRAFGGGFLGLYEDRQGRLWIGTSERGLFRYDPATETTVQVPLDPAGTSVLSRHVQVIYEDEAGAIWIGTLGGLYRYDPHRKQFGHIHHDPNDANSLSSDIAMGLYEEAGGVLWVGTLGGGLNRVDRMTGTVTRYRHDPDDSGSLCHDEIWALHADRQGHLWIGTNGGLCRFDPYTEQFVPYTLSAQDEPYVNVIVEDRAGTLWIGGERLYAFDPATGDVARYLGISTNVQAIHVASPDTVWVGMEYGGLIRLERDPLRVTKYPHAARDRDGLLGKAVRFIHRGSDGSFWLGTDMGFVRFDPRSGSFRHYLQRDGLPGSEVYGILEDEAHHLWVSTNRGLVRFDPGREQVDLFEAEEGTGNTEYNRRAAFKSSTGAFFFGGLDGVTTFFPKAVRANPYVPPVVVTQIQVSNRHGTTTRNPAQGRRDGLVLDHQDYSFSFEFAALNFTHPEKNQYAYRLEGVDEDWVEAGTRRFARYTGVPPGRYVFRVKGANNDGVWNEEGTSIKLMITPPFWQTTWFYFLCALVLMAGAFGGYGWRVRQLKKHHRALEREVAARTRELVQEQEKTEAQAARLMEMEQLKTRFYANMSHEFRTPLTLILGPLNDLLDGVFGPLTGSQHDQLTLMQRNSVRLRRLINQLLDVSKLEAGRMALHPEPHDLVVVLRRIVWMFAALAERRHITLQFETEADDLVTLCDAGLLEKVVYNLLSNALKFTPEGGKVRVRLHEALAEDGLCVEIRVRDTGPGIPPGERERIFDRFHRVDGSATRQHDGTGIGLSLARELITLHGGALSVESEPGFGSEFVVLFPLVPGGAAQPGRAAAPEEQGFWTEAQASYVALQEHRAEEDAVLPEGPVTPPRGIEMPTILIVDDQADVRRYLRSRLVEDYRIIEAANGAEGVDKALAYVPDLVISDVMMPVLDGYALCRTLKTHARLRHIPVVLLTARADEESKLEGLEVGADDYLCKPFSAAELLARVENLIEIRRQLRERFSETVVVKPGDVEVTSVDAVFLEQVRAVVEAQLENGTFSVEMLADAVGLSRRQLDRRLKALTHLSASGLIRKMRLERAAQLLVRRAAPVTEVARAVGFDHAGYFAKLFRQTFGVAPSDYADRGVDESQA